MKYYIAALITCCVPNIYTMDNSQDFHEQCRWNTVVAHYGEFEEDIASGSPLDRMCQYLKKNGWNERLGVYLVAKAHAVPNHEAQVILSQFHEMKQQENVNVDTQNVESEIS